MTSGLPFVRTSMYGLLRSPRKLLGALCLSLVVVSPAAAGTMTYGYDVLHRLTSVQYPDGSSIAYTYDPAGNLLTTTTISASADGDFDGVPDAVDNCPGVENPGQEDNDGDGIGDACDDDDDNDGLSDADEALYGTDPLNPDTDGDGVSDGDEVAAGRNPLLNEAVIQTIIEQLLMGDE